MFNQSFSIHSRLKVLQPGPLQKKHKLQVEFEVFSAVTLKSAVFWAVALLATV
jgi:hypothetical protein